MERILLLGGSGILGSEVLSQLRRENFDYLAPPSVELDIRNKNQINKSISEFKPTWIINCAAWTNVDGAESSFEEARQLNSVAVENIGIEADLVGCKVIHISTDYVFDGEGITPYAENDVTNPINVYGKTKLEGEYRLREKLEQNSFIIRTSWLYGAAGKNFVKTIAGRALRGEETRVVDDQVGSPTCARDLADGIFSILRNQPESGIYNYSNRGTCSWFKLAQEIYVLLGADKELVHPIESTSISFIAKRPKFSLLSKDKWTSARLSTVPEWEDSLQLMMPEIICELQ
jgi:dTDP-4-dehydrorhamnose reductase